VNRLKALCLLLLLAFGIALPSASYAADSATVFMYHRFGEEEYPTTNVRLDQFEAHIQELVNGPYTVWPLPKILDRLKKGKALPENTVAITIDDAYLSVYEKAWPRLKRYNLPFTLFVATDAVDRKNPNYMSWQQIRELKRKGATIGSQTASHGRMINKTPDQNRAEIAKSNDRFKEELNFRPTLFAYPFGEYSSAVLEVIKNSGFDAAFGQHSGAFDGGSNLLELPRFAINEQYGDLDRFKLAANTLALPIREITPSNPLLSKSTNPPAFGFTLDQDVGSLKGLNCFASGQDKPDITILGENRVEIRLKKAYNPGRGRINCTLSAGNNKWYWLGRQFFIP